MFEKISKEQEGTNTYIENFSKRQEKKLVLRKISKWSGEPNKDESILKKYSKRLR